MSVSSEIARIKVARNKIRDKLVAWGVAKATDNITILSQELAKQKKIESVAEKLSEGETYSIPKGYHDGNGTVTAPVVCRVLDVTGIGDYQFQFAKGIEGTKTLVLPNVENIGVGGFMTAREIETIDIGEKVKTIHPSAFNNCSDLTKLIFRGLWLAEGGGLLLNGTPIDNKVGYIYVPDKYLAQYKAAENWKARAYQIKPLSEIEGADVSAVTASAEDVISGKVFVASDCSVINGAMPKNGDVSGVIDTVNNTSVTIPKGYTTGGAVSLVGQFAGAVYPWKVIEDVNIADRQFANGTGLVGVRTAILPNVETIGTASFISAKELEIIDIGENG